MILREEIIGLRDEQLDIEDVPIERHRHQARLHTKDAISTREDQKNTHVKAYAATLSSAEIAGIVNRRRVGLATERTRVIADRRVDGLGTGESNSQIYFDASHALIVEENGIPKAVLAFEYDENEVAVFQMQWVDRGNRASGRWEFALLDLAEDYARKHGQQQVTVRPSSQNGWVQSGKMSAEVAHLRYDVSPKRVGYSSVGGRQVKKI